MGGQVLVQLKADEGSHSETHSRVKRGDPLEANPIAPANSDPSPIENQPGLIFREMPGLSEPYMGVN
jgi:hypothetical protein